MVAFIEDASTDLSGDLGLSTTDQRYRAGLQIGGDPVHGRPGGPQGLYLRAVFDRADRGGDLRGPHEPGGRQCPGEVD